MRERAGRVEELLARPGYPVLLAAVRERLEASGDPATITLRGLDPGARRALADLLGRRSIPGEVVRVRVADLDQALRDSRVGAGLVEILEADGGPLDDRRGARDAERAAWRTLWDEALEAGASCEPGPREHVRVWLEGLRADGLVARLTDGIEDARLLLEDAVAVVGRLPARGVPLTRLAAEVTGDAHALDPGRPLATLVLRAAASLTGSKGVPSGGRARRRLWARVGVVCDPVSVSVLGLGLRARGSGLLARTLAAHAEAGEPVRLTLRQLVREDIEAADRRVYCCENPSVVAAAADALGGPCRPIVCVDGMPDSAADSLLTMLAEDGVEVRFHADFDRGGLRVGNLLVDRYGAVPWRFRAADYLEALDVATASAPLGDGDLTAAWDPALAAEMRRAGKAVPEEQLIDGLLEDLADGRQ